jgi:hypothetical protein
MSRKEKKSEMHWERKKMHIPLTKNPFEMRDKRQLLILKAIPPYMLLYWYQFGNTILSHRK